MAKHRRKTPRSNSHPRARQPKAFKHVIGPDGWSRRIPYEPGVINVDWAETLSRVRSYEPDFALLSLLASYTQHWMRGHAANICAQACIHFQDAAALLGIDSAITPVRVLVDESHGRQAVYGSTTPHWEGRAFSGHCTVFAPGEGRLVDLTIRQIDGFQRLPYPYIGRVVYSTTSGHTLPPGARLRVEVIDRHIEYHVVEGGEALIRDAEAAQLAVTANPDLPNAIAAQTLEVVRTLGIAERLPARHTHIRELLQAIGSAPLHEDGSRVTFLVGGSPVSVDALLD
jgi:hypothetical protein